MLPAAFVREIVAAATSRRVEGPWCSAVRCTASARQPACGARIHVRLAARGRAEWSCPLCVDTGVITGFEGTELDLSPYVPRKKKLRVWGLEDESRDLLFTTTTWIPTLRAVVARAHPVDTGPGLRIVEATVAELNEMYTLVEDLSDAKGYRRRRHLLDALRASLSTAIDGF